MSAMPTVAMNTLIRRSRPLRPLGSLGFNAAPLRALTVGPDVARPPRRVLGARRISTPRRREEEDAPSSTFSKKTTERLQRYGPLGSAVLLFGGKTKYLFTALKLGKFSSLASLFASTGAYALFFGPAFGVGLIGQILVHESGHALAMRALGIPHGPMVFIPFMGAAVEMQKHPHSAKEEAIVAYAGPLAGCAAAMAFATYGAVTGSQLAYALADVGFMINLFNLLPIGSMDGGRITGALSKHFLLGGLGLGFGIAYAGVVHNPIFYLILMLASFGTYERYFGKPPSKYYFQLTDGARAGIGFAYLALIAFMVGAMAVNNKNRLSPSELRRRQGGQMSESERKLARWSEELGDAEYVGFTVDKDPYAIGGGGGGSEFARDPYA